MSNTIAFAGRLAKDAEKRSTATGTSVLSFTVANDVGFGDRKTTNWFRCAVWGKRADGQLGDYLKKGTQVFVTGELSTREWQTQDGETRTDLVVNVNALDLVGGKPDQKQAQPQPQPVPAGDGFEDSDIPF